MQKANRYLASAPRCARHQSKGHAHRHSSRCFDVSFSQRRFRHESVAVSMSCSVLLIQNFINNPPIFVVLKMPNHLVSIAALLGICRNEHGTSEQHSPHLHTHTGKRRFPWSNNRWRNKPNITARGEKRICCALVSLLQHNSLFGDESSHTSNTFNDLGLKRSITGPHIFHRICKNGEEKLMKDEEGDFSTAAKRPETIK